VAVVCYSTVRAHVESHPYANEFYAGIMNIEAAGHTGKLLAINLNVLIYVAVILRHQVRRGHSTKDRKEKLLMVASVQQE